MTHSQRPGLISLRRIESWNRGIELVVDVYALTNHFPREISSRLGYISDDLFCAAIDRTDHICRMLTKMYQNMTSRP